MHVESLGKPRDVSKRSQALPAKLDIKRHSPSILYIHAVVLNLLVLHFGHFLYILYYNRNRSALWCKLQSDNSLIVSVADLKQ